MSSSSVLDIPADLHALRLNSNSPSLSLGQPPTLADHHLPAYELIVENEVDDLSLEIEKERLHVQYI